MDKCLIVTGGQTSHSFLKKWLTRTAYAIIIGVDHGNDALLAVGKNPNMVLGDLDSISETTLAYLKEAPNIKWITFDTVKDDTDTGLALLKAVEQGLTYVDIIGATGTRIDHLLGNLQLLEAFYGKLKLRIIDEFNQVELFKGPITTKCYKDDYSYFSLLPISEAVVGITITEAHFPLNNDCLIRGSTKGISNQWIENVAEITVEAGTFILVKSHD